MKAQASKAALSMPTDVDVLNLDPASQGQQKLERIHRKRLALGFLALLAQDSHVHLAVNRMQHVGGVEKHSERVLALHVKGQSKRQAQK